MATRYHADCCITRCPVGTSWNAQPDYMPVYEMGHDDKPSTGMYGQSVCLVGFDVDNV